MPDKILFYGTPDFAVAILDRLVQEKKNIVGVVTAPDKPAGRGNKLSESAIKKYALEKGLRILQPDKLKGEAFLNELKAINPDLQIVVAFRMLPEVVWNYPRLGTFNLHASLLPQYRGAAPIHWAIINGETETGVSTFFLQHEIDTGDILLQEKIAIAKDETVGTLHDKLMYLGADLVLKTLEKIETNTITKIAQNSLPSAELKHAPKLTKENTKINWHKTGQELDFFIRGLNPFPCSWSIFAQGETKYMTKIYLAKPEKINHSEKIGTVVTDQKTFLKVAVADGFLHILDLQLEGKKRMRIDEFLRGFKITEPTFFE